MLLCVLLLVVLAVLPAAMGGATLPKIRKEWMSEPVKHQAVARVNAANTTEIPTYLIYSFYQKSVICAAGTQGVSGGIKFDSCIPGDESNESSTMYTNPSQDDASLKMSVRSYSSADCTGAFKSYPTTIPKACIPTDTGSIAYQLTQSSSPLSAFHTSGTASLNFYTQDSCAKGGNGGDVFMFQPLNQCMTVDSSDANVKSQFISACANGKRTINQFSDETCHTLVSSATYPLSNCLYSASANVYETDICATV